MSGKVINLRRAKKQRKRAEARDKVTSPTPSRQDKANAELEQKRLEAHRRDDDEH
ncbi:DUF4169 domain-containing protein [Oceanibium sediminis]|uniref:DUF4169 domain-containing protein n=1 Tax=Oceanibium sediminis TaxID=2026339 RepID=UPI000DD32D43|nr:DUF4169 domain-containing protein [Oceanibium sediminis]